MAETGASSSTSDKKKNFLCKRTGRQCYGDNIFVIEAQKANIGSTNSSKPSTPTKTTNPSNDPGTPTNSQVQPPNSQNSSTPTNPPTQQMLTLRNTPLNRVFVAHQSSPGRSGPKSPIGWVTPQKPEIPDFGVEDASEHGTNKQLVLWASSLYMRHVTKSMRPETTSTETNTDPEVNPTSMQDLQKRLLEQNELVAQLKQLILQQSERIKELEEKVDSSAKKQDIVDQSTAQHEDITEVKAVLSENHKKSLEKFMNVQTSMKDQKTLMMANQTEIKKLASKEDLDSGIQMVLEKLEEMNIARPERVPVASSRDSEEFYNDCLYFLEIAIRKANIAWPIWKNRVLTQSKRMVLNPVCGECTVDVHAANKACLANAMAKQIIMMMKEWFPQEEELE